MFHSNHQSSKNRIVLETTAIAAADMTWDTIHNPFHKSAQFNPRQAHLPARLIQFEFQSIDLSSIKL
jgi:hypothetical protein